MQNLALKEIDYRLHRQQEIAKPRKQTIFEIILSNGNLPPAEKAFDRISHEGVVTIAAGGETTARALTMATYFVLSAKGTVLTKLQEELKNIMPDLSSTPPLKDLERLPWLVSIIQAAAPLTQWFTYWRFSDSNN